MLARPVDRFFNAFYYEFRLRKPVRVRYARVDIERLRRHVVNYGHPLSAERRRVKGHTENSRAVFFPPPFVNVKLSDKTVFVHDKFKDNAHRLGKLNVLRRYGHGRHGDILLNQRRHLTLHIRVDDIGV